MTAPFTPASRQLAEALARQKARDRRNRWLVVGFAVAGAATYAASYLLPWWQLHMVAPQYPQGLDVQIGLYGVTGAVAEIDILNHYIGMHSLSDAAALETRFAVWALSAVVLSVVAALIAAGRKLGWLALVPAIGLPVGFVADVFGWMWHFGHDLDPTAPIEFAEFTPQMFGPGTIGQFHTWAWPAGGFWVALAGIAFVVAAEVFRRRVCRACPKAGECGATCPYLMVLKEKRS
jgi:hypothetical protein